MFGKAIIAYFFEFVNDFESYFLIYAKNDGFIPIFLGKAAVFYYLFLFKVIFYGFEVASLKDGKESNVHKS